MSFTLNRNSNNTLCPTLFENTTISVPKYLWQFDNTAGSFYCIATELGTQLTRNNEFIIKEVGTATPNPLLGEVKLKTGDYTYTIYEQVSATNLIPTGLKIVEIGDVFVKDISANVNKKYIDGIKTNKTYTP